jgi:hypothetical protein
MSSRQDESHHGLHLHRWLMSRVIGDSRGPCRKRGLPSFTSSVVSSPSPRQPRAMAYPANIYTGCSRGITRAAWRRSTRKSRRPASSLRAVSDEVIAAIVRLRERLCDDLLHIELPGHHDGLLQSSSAAIGPIMPIISASCCGQTWWIAVISTSAPST